MNEVTTVEKNEVIQVNQPTQLIQLAIAQNADVDKLEKLMEMQERWESREAKKAFNHAISEFQSICPRIVKSKQGHGYKYATLGDIQAQIREAARKCGLSWRWETNEQTEEKLTVKCIVTHVDGHSQETESTTYIEAPNKMQSRTQMVGVATTYAQRYSLIGALGISTADEDMDGRLPQEFREKELYTRFKHDRESMQNAIDSGRPADDIIEQLEKQFKVSEAVKSAILGMEKTK
jgi:hypothetical protein